MQFEEWKQKNYKMWNTEQAYMLACEGTPEEENAVDKYSKMIWEAAQKEHMAQSTLFDPYCGDEKCIKNLKISSSGEVIEKKKKRRERCQSR